MKEARLSDASDVLAALDMQFARRARSECIPSTHPLLGKSMWHVHRRRPVENVEELARLGSCTLGAATMIGAPDCSSRLYEVRSRLPETPTVALVLGGGAARGLAHIGVLEVLEHQRIPISYITGSSMGGLVGALAAAGISAHELAGIARSFRFPKWFLPGGMVRWESLFPGAAEVLEPLEFESLPHPLLVMATDLEAGQPVVLRTGAVLPAVRATCAVPGVLAPERIEGRWLVDGGVIALVPVDVAWTTDPDVVIAVSVGSRRARRMPQLEWPLTSWLAKLGRSFPNPATAKVSLEILIRASEIALDRSAALLAAMGGPDVLIEPDVRDIELREFGRLDEAIAAGRSAAIDALPAIRRLLAQPLRPREARRELEFDPVCKMVVTPARARASLRRNDREYFFCSDNCRECFERDPGRYLPLNTR